jgi:hypothetical protein
MALFCFTTRRTREDKYLRALEVRVATWVLLLIGEKIVAPDENHFEPPGGVAGELWPFVVAFAFAFRVMTFVSDHMPLCRSEGHLKTLIQSSKAQQGKRSKYALRFGIY